MRPRYTRPELLAELARRGYTRTPRWHEEWIGLGLLDLGERLRRGDRRRGWSQEQVELASVLLHHVERGAYLAALPNVVVGMWLWFGDAYVPFRQIPRALRTWIAGEREPAEKHVRASARDLVTKVAHAQGSGKRRLVRALVDFTYRPDAEPEQLRDLFDDVFDRDRTGRARGPDGAGLSTNSYMDLMQARIEARAQVGSYVEAEYRAARELYRWSRMDYAQAQPGYAQNSDLGRFYEVPDLNEVANSACPDLLTCLAAVRRRAQPQNRGA